jgi:RNA polymerase sigma-70 factor (ECF subfamily)
MRLVAARHARRVLRHRFDESDVVQITCLEAFRCFKQFAGSSLAEFQSWLEGILERQLMGQWRQHTAKKRDFRREATHDEADARLSFVWSARNATARSPADELICGEVAMMMAEALESLDADYRIVLEMRFIDQQKLREIAEKLEVSTGVVAGRLRRGLEQLQQLLPTELRELLGD